MADFLNLGWEGLPVLKRSERQASSNKKRLRSISRALDLASKKYPKVCF